ncbi:MAG: hypothetical protein R3F61_21975 [Myxococcota bacterium]
MLLLFAQAAVAGCPAPTTPDRIVQSVVRGEIAIQNGDAVGLNQAALTARVDLPCLDALLDAGQVAAMARLFGYDAFVGRRRDEAAVWFAIARDLEPSYQLPLVVVPEHHPMRTLYDSTVPPRTGTRLLDLPAGNTARVNGLESVTYPVGQPWVLQQVDGTGRVALSALVAADAPPPVIEGAKGAPLDWGLSVRGDLAGWARKGRTQLTLGPSVRFDLPLAGSLGADAVLGFGFGLVQEGLTLVPSLRVGARWELEGGPRLRFGAALLFASHGYAPVAPGAAIVVGVRPGGLDADLQLGYSGALTAGLAVGRAFR